MTIGDEEDNARYIDAEMLFESYLDRDSGAWSIRRITASPPPCDDNEESPTEIGNESRSESSPPQE